VVQTQIKQNGITYENIADAPGRGRRTTRWVYSIVAGAGDDDQIARVHAIELALQLEALRVKLPDPLLERLRSEEEVPVALILPGEGARFGRMLADELIRIPGIGAGQRSTIAACIEKSLLSYERFCKTPLGKELAYRLRSQLQSHPAFGKNRWRLAFEQYMFHKSVVGDVVVIPNMLEALRRRYEPQFPKSPKRKDSAK